MSAVNTAMGLVLLYVFVFLVIVVAVKRGFVRGQEQGRKVAAVSGRGTLDHVVVKVDADTVEAKAAVDALAESVKRLSVMAEGLTAQLTKVAALMAVVNGKDSMPDTVKPLQQDMEKI